MKLLLFCGSPHAKGTTAYALSLVAEEVEAAGIECVTYQLGARPVHGCIACGRCSQTGRCTFDDDGVNEFIDLLGQSDGLVLGAPTYYFGANGAAKAFLDRAFYASPSSYREHKPAAVLSVARRAGAVTAEEDLLHFPMICQMPIVTTCYLPVMFGHNPAQAAQDEEGVRIMRTLGRNMAWLLKCIDAARKAGIEPPEPLPPAMTNFIR
jgi:multimeric flavodoxin WrbA